ncbi:MAG: ATP-binding protein [Dictyoglomus thermophilum]|uniref:ATP-binding protein n=1 Tax=Dictyoglomus thermophilum TaxID=14 RepID=A0A7V3ZHX2_DICTH|nr:ATP-binding protein [Dictyoglomus thermophilum]MCX7720382.1 ATP-binding protein [Dictyoglomus thermophilum]TYT24476.1 ATP-binding protein [Dictyoglomus thermophilum]
MELKCVGYLVGESYCDNFQFITNEELAPKRLEYVVIKGIASSNEEVEVLAQVESLKAFSDVLSEDQEYDATTKLLELNYKIPLKLIASARVLGYLDKDGNILLPRSVSLPGSPVYLAPDDLLQRFFTHNKSTAIEIGTLLYRPNVKVTLDPNGLRRHLAIIAQTGAGKSYLTGLLLEKLVKLGATILVFDPNSDYVLLRRKRNNLKEFSSIAHNVTIYRIPKVQGRFSDDMIGGVESYSIRFSELENEQIAEILGISEYSNIRDAVEKAIEELRESRIDFTPNELYEKLKDMAGIEEKDEEDFSLDFDDYERKIIEKMEKKNKKKYPEETMIGARKALKYVKWIKDYPIWGFKDISPEKILKPAHISVIDLAGIEKNLQDLVVSKLLNDIWTKAKSEGLPYPLFIVLEEAHNLVPKEKGEKLKSARIINSIAAEGRKFKVFLIVVTQRPYKISSNTLSQCGSQIIMRLTNPTDQTAVKEASEALSENLFQDLPGLNIGEAIILGRLTKIPVMVKIGERETAEGGFDIDLEEEFQKALDNIESTMIEKNDIEILPDFGSEI